MESDRIIVTLMLSQIGAVLPLRDSAPLVWVHRLKKAHRLYLKRSPELEIYLKSLESKGNDLRVAHREVLHFH